MVKKAIITAAITGAIHIPAQSDYLPIAPEEIARQAIDAGKAGAAIAHIHVRDPQDGHPVPDAGLFKQVCTRIKEESDIILCLTTGGDPTTMTVQQRLQPVIDLEPELASLNSGSFNFALHPLTEKITAYKYDWEKPYLLSTENNIHNNTFKSIREYLEIYAKTNTRPEFEVYDMGQINNLKYFADKGIIKPPYDVQFVLGILGGLPATVENLVHIVDTAKKALGEENIRWSVVGAGKLQMSLGAVALAMGGNVRVGLEDSVWLSKGVMAKSNAEQVAKIVRIAGELSVDIATPGEAREMLATKGQDNVKF